MDAMPVKGDPTHARQGTTRHVSTEKEEGYSSSGYPTTAHAATRTFVRSASSVGPDVDDLRAIKHLPSYSESTVRVVSVVCVYVLYNLITGYFHLVDEYLGFGLSITKDNINPHQKLCEMASVIQLRANKMLNANGRWERQQQQYISGDSDWIWVQNYTDTGERRTPWQSMIPPVLSSGNNRLKNDTYSMDKSTNYSNNIMLAMYGSSYTRVIFLELERLHYNISTRNTCEEYENEEQLPSGCQSMETWDNLLIKHPEYGLIQRNGNCMPHYQQYSVAHRSDCSSPSCTNLNFLAGFDIDTCGPPGFRVWDVNNNTNATLPHMQNLQRGKAAIGFKNYMHTPEADNLFIQRIEAVNMRTVDVAIVEMGSPWSARGQLNTPNKSLPTNMTLREEIEYYVNFVHDVAFPETLVIWIATCGCNIKEDRKGGGDINEIWDVVKQKDLSIVLDKRFLCNTKPQEMPAGHGCAGPLVNVLARMVLHLLHYINGEMQSKVNSE